MRSLAYSLLALVGLAACATFPEVDDHAPEAGPPPPLMPLEQLLEQARLTPDDPGPALAARAARLKARAAAIGAVQPET